LHVMGIRDCPASPPLEGGEMGMRGKGEHFY
jgi:hypothetical protein